MPRLSLAAATVGDLAPADAVECAAAAGFALAGVRPPEPADDVPAVAAALRRTGVALLDYEYVRLAPGPLTDAQRRASDAAGDLAARFLLVVSDDPDTGATAAKLAELRDRLAGARTVPALEFMAFTAVRDLAGAVALAERVPGVRVLVDALHLVRCGDTTAALGAVDPGLLGYVQLCDAAGPAPDGPAALAREARHDRLPPGHGDLPLARFLAALPAGIPLSLEVQSDHLHADLDPVARARLVRDAARALLDYTDDSSGG